jgi:hypothetical protein
MQAKAIPGSSFSILPNPVALSPDMIASGEINKIFNFPDFAKSITF